MILYVIKMEGDVPQTSLYTSDSFDIPYWIIPVLRIYIFFSCMGKKEEEKQGQDISDLIIILKHFTSQVETDFHPKGYWHNTPVSSYIPKNCSSEKL